jgi:glycerol-3-phosphate acyltransferase PlsX
MMKIGLDAMGGDYAPIEACKGIKAYLADPNTPADAIVYAIGVQEQLEPLLADVPKDRCVIVHAPDVVGMHEHPTKALKEKPNSSINLGFYLLAKGDIDAFISAGNTGMMLVGAAHIIKTIEGVMRPSIPTLVPYQDGRFGLLLDVGINADCKPENLEQFAVLGSNYAEHVLKIENPKIGLLNIGEEEGKGNLLAKSTFPLLKDNPFINFIGNMEGRDLLVGKADVIVCDGFTGNIMLKLCESIYQIFHEERKVQDEYLNHFNYEAYGGTPVLGVNKTVIVGHGISNENAFCKMLQQGYNIASSNLLEKLKGKFAIA